MTIENKMDFPGEIALECRKEGREYELQLERLEPCQTERVLGVHLPMYEQNWDWVI